MASGADPAVTNDTTSAAGKGCCSGAESPPAATAERDPVCGMSVDPAPAAYHADHDGVTFHFCSAGCRAKFIADPAKYLAKAAAPAPPPEGVIWTCPMHPQIRLSGPGSCPICGMALEPEQPSLDDKPNPELVDFTRRLWVAGVLSVPLLIVSMGAEMFGWHFFAPQNSAWVQLALTAPIVLWAGAPFFARGWTSLLTRRLNMFTLIAIGVGAAFAYSLAATLVPSIFPVGFRMNGSVPVYYEAAGVVVDVGAARPGSRTPRPRCNRQGNPRAA